MQSYYANQNDTPQGRVSPLQKSKQPRYPASHAPQSLQAPHQQTSYGSYVATPQMGTTQNSNSASPRQLVQHMSEVNNQMQHQHQQQMVIHETFSIPMLERKMMFLNEPSLQASNLGTVVNEKVRHLWRIHFKQMSNMPQDETQLGRPQQDAKRGQAEVDCVPKRPESIEEIGGQLGFSAPSQRPRDFNKFQNAVRNQLNELSRAHRDLRSRFKQAGSEVDKDIQRIEQLTGHIQSVFNDFALCFNSFVQREERLETLHHQAIKKSKELSKKIQLEVMAQSSQRSQLLAIVDDLTCQLRETKASTVKTSTLKSEHQAHQATRELVEKKQKQIETMDQEIKALNASLQQFGQSSESWKQQKLQLEEQIGHLNGVIQEQKEQIEDLSQRRFQLEQDVSRLKSQIELTQSSKDKIILKLKQEMRMNAIANTTVNLNGTLGAALNNTSALGAAQHNVSTNYLNNSQVGATMAANKQIHPMQMSSQIQYNNDQSRTPRQQ